MLIQSEAEVYFQCTAIGVQSMVLSSDESASAHINYIELIMILK